MINSIISFSVHNKLIIGLFTIFLIGWGVYAVQNIPIDAVPDITNNQVQIITTSQSLAAQEVEQFITYPVELAMANLPGLKEIRSISRFGLSVVTVVFEEDMGTFLPRQLVAEQLKEAQENIGDQFGTPAMAPITTGLGEIYQYTLETQPGYDSAYTPTELRTIQDWIVKRQLSMIPGVVEINSFGGFLKQYEVAVNPDKLNAYNLTLADIFTALEMNNENTGGSYIEKDPEMYYIRGKGLVGSLDDIRQIVVTNRQGVPVTVGDVGEVGIGQAPRFGAATKDGKGETVIGVVMMLKDANSAQVIESVKQRVAEVQKTLPEGIRIEPFLDRTRLVNKTISTVAENLLIGGAIVIVALIFLLGTWRSGFIVASVIPLSMLFALGMMQATGVSANLLSLGALDFGIIVDGAVIIVEFMAVQLVRNHRKLNELTGQKKQGLLDDIAVDASGKMMNAAIFGQLIILIVFLPILSLTEVEGKMFRPMALSFSFAILGAMILCLTYVPMISALLLHGSTQGKKSWGDHFMERLQQLYTPVIHWALRAKVIVVTVAVVLLVVAGWLFSTLGGEFIPKLDEGDFALETRMGPGISLPEMKRNMGKLEKILLDSFPEVQTVVTKIGAAEIPTDPVPIEASDIMVALKNEDEWVSADSKDALAEKMAEALEVIPGLTVEFSQPIEMRFNELLTGVKSDVAIKIYGDDLAVLQQKGNAAATIIRTVSGAADVKVEQVTGLPQIVINYQRDRVAQYGLTIRDLNQIVSTAFAGSVAGTVYEGERRFDLVVRLQDRFRHDINAVRDLYVPLPNGQKVPLSTVAEIDFEEAPAQISRDNTQRRIVIGVNVRNRDTQSLVNDIQGKLANQLSLPPGYSITYGGQFENLRRAKDRLSVVVPIVLALIFMILFISLRSFKETLLIYTAIPFAAVGGVIALWLRGMPFSISAGVGFIALFGVAVLNGLVLISSLNELKSEGVDDRKERILQATKSRLRPIFLTASTDILGFLPMALSTSSGAEVQRPLATVVIGGIFTATLLTLVVLPVLYDWVDRPIKVNKLALTVITLLVVVSFPSTGQAQQDSSKTEEPVSLEEVIHLARENNASLQADQYRIESSRARKGTAFDPGKTAFDVYYGQTNSFANDIGFSVGQSFSFPTVYTSRSKLFQAQLHSSELQKAVTANELIRQVKSAYYQILYLQAARQLLQRQDTIYTNFVQAAALRFQTGETNLLEKASAETQLMEVRNLLVQNQANIAGWKQQLQSLLNVQQPLHIEEPPDLLRELSLPLDTAALIRTNPDLAYTRQQIDIAERNTRVEKAQLLPDFSVGYDNQSLQGDYTINGTSEYVGRGTRFESFSAGISVPILFKAHTSRIRSAKLETQAAAADYQQARQNLQGEFARTVQEYRALRSTVQYYENTVLPQAEIILQNAQLGFNAGEIDYVAFVQGVNQALTIRTNYLNAINQYNQSVINLEFLLGQQAEQ